ncbi:hypothetical protein NE691_11660 [Enterococcus faecalis]|uniref:hypothetical protein n=1 Tax=Enterococcus faecalis TaxID=1351 RepID=UPI00210E726E|nr:hypothetical protein [Enterococcus faecalis]MCQ4859184.1 hypothetical protein [Enterococcus faecalis]
MKKVLLGIGFVGVLILSGCGNAKNLVDYVDVEFTGMDTQGEATYSVNTEEMIYDTMKIDSDTISLTDKQKNEIRKIDTSYKIKLDKDKNLSNGDKVKVTATVNKEKTKKLKSGEKTVEVKGLEEPKKLTNEEVSKHLVVNFNGANGQGEAQIDNTFDNELKYIGFKIANDGKLKNGDQAKLDISKQLKQELSGQGYVLDKGFNPTFEVKGLDEVAENATDIANLDDIKRMIDEGVRREYKSSDKNEYSWDRQYEIKEDKLMYRQFKTNTRENENIWGSSYGSSQNGNLIKIFTVKQYSGGPEGKLEETKTVIYGYSDIILNDKKEANVADLTEISDSKDDTYSLESVIKLYEGYGYKEVK